MSLTLVDLKLFYPQKADTTQHCQTHPNFSTGNSQGIVWMCSMICWDQVLEVKFFYINMYVSKKYCFYVCYLYVYMYMYMCVCVYTYVYVHMCVYVSVYTYVYIYLYICKE